MADNTNDLEEAASETSTTPKIKHVPWFLQLRVALKKNMLLLSRRPVQLALMCLCSVGSVLLVFTSISNNEYKVDFGTIPLTQCGAVDQAYLNELEREQGYDAVYSTPSSYNMQWARGLPVTLMGTIETLSTVLTVLSVDASSNFVGSRFAAFGPMFHAILVFIIVQVDIQTQMLGILRGAGMRESVFWMSWWVPFTFTSLVNALGGAITAKSISSIHAFENIYFMGIFGSFFFLNIALVGASFFLAAVCGTARGGTGTWLIVLLLVAQWSVFLHQLISVQFVDSADLANSVDTTPQSIFWTNKQTEKRSFGGAESCDIPIVSKAQADVFRLDPSGFPEDEFFVGCYFGAGYTTSIWNQDRRIGNAILFWFPYVHFTGAWSNFLGYTGMPNRSFERSHASMSPEQLAIASLPMLLPGDNRSTLFPQGTTLNVEQKFSSSVSATNCPPSTITEGLCPDLFTCPSAAENSPTNSPSVNGLFGYMFCLAVIYTLMAAYYAQVRPGRVS